MRGGPLNPRAPLKRALVENRIHEVSRERMEIKVVRNAISSIARLVAPWMSKPRCTVPGAMQMEGSTLRKVDFKIL